MSEPTDPDPLQLIPLPGSERDPAAGARLTGEALDPSARLEITVVLRRRAPLPDPATSPRLTPGELAASYGADPADVTTVTETLTALGLEIVGTDPASRRIRVAGTLAALSQVFGVSLSSATSSGPTGEVPHRHRTGGLSVPSTLAGVVTAVLGLDDRPQSRMLSIVAAPGAVATSYSPPELATVYAFPADTDGSGQTIAIVELGGGFTEADLDAYFEELSMTGPAVTAVGVDGATNQPTGDPDGPDGEVQLDIEVAGALAPGASLVVYFAPNTDAGFLDAVSQAASADPTPTAISISWGQSEDSWTAQARGALDAAMADAVSMGTTVTCASGDDGSADRATDGASHVDFPASSPHALGCGGTRLMANGTTGAVQNETVWNSGAGNGASGGGVSDVFAVPDWQQAAGAPPPTVAGTGRGVPDVAAVADPATGYRVRVDGSDLVFGGTSAVAPLWAALVARLAQQVGSALGLVQPALYGGITPGAGVAGFRDITVGNNGAFKAGPGWDPCTGLGVPVGNALVAVVSGSDTGGSAQDG